MYKTALLMEYTFNAVTFIQCRLSYRPYLLILYYIIAYFACMCFCVCICHVTKSSNTSKAWHLISSFFTVTTVIMKCLRTEEYVQQLSCVKDTLVLHDELKVKIVFYVS